MKLSLKLPLIIIAAVLITGLVIGVKSYFSSANELRKEAENRIISLLESRKNELKNYLGTIEQDLRFQASNPLVISALGEYKAAWDKIGSEQESYLQKTYIENNPNPLGQKDALDYAEDGTEYSAVHKKYHPWLRQFLKERGYYDIFLFDTNGDIIYTVFKELDFATNAKSGKWKDSDIGNIFNSVSGKAEAGYISFFDFKPYAPSNNVPAGFIGTTIMNDGKMAGVLVYQMPIATINSIMQASAGLGETGEMFIVGEDMLMRNDSRFSKESTILSRKIDTEQVKLALGGKKGVIEGVNFAGNEVLAAYDYIDFYGAKLALVAEIESSEVFAPLDSMRNELVVGSLVILVVIASIGLFVSRRISGQIGRMAGVMGDISRGENADIPYIKAKDEVGDIARALQQINDVGQAAVRVRNALDNASSSVMMADISHKIVYLNKAAENMFVENEASIRKEMENFDSSKIVGSSLDDFFFNSGVHNHIPEGLADTKKSTLKIGTRIFDLTVNPVRNQKNQVLGIVVEWINVTTIRAEEDVRKGIETEVAAVVDAVAAGDFSKKLQTSGRSGFLLSLCQGMNRIGDVSYNALSEVVTTLGFLSKGDLTRKISGDYGGMLNDIKQGINGTIDQLKEMVEKIKSTANSVNQASGEIASGSSDLSHRTEQQASSLEETSASMNELTAAVKNNTENANKASEISIEAKNVAEKGGKITNDAVKAMSGITSSSKKMSDIIGVIEDIAFQTNLLALNAAVEAARAGDAGKGFAVVASEVRTLAGRSADAAKEIKNLITDSTSQINNGSKLVNQAGDSLKEIIDVAGKAAEIISQISSASSEQSTGITQINAAVSQMEEMTQQNAALVEENTAAAQSLVEQAEELNKLMEFFKIDGEISKENEPKKLPGRQKRLAA